MKKKKTIVFAIMVLLTSGLVYFFLTASESLRYSVTHFCRHYDQKLEIPRQLRDVKLVLPDQTLDPDSYFSISKKRDYNCTYHERNIEGVITPSIHHEKIIGEFKIEEVIYTNCLSGLFCINTGDPGLKLVIEDDNSNKYIVEASYLYGKPAKRPTKYHSYIKKGEQTTIFEIDKYFPQYLNIN